MPPHRQPGIRRTALDIADQASALARRARDGQPSVGFILDTARLEADIARGQDDTTITPLDIVLIALCKAQADLADGKLHAVSEKLRDPTLLEAMRNLGASPPEF